PMKVFLQNRNKSFNVEIINHPLLTPALASISLESVFSSEYKDFGFQAIRVNGKIFIENEKNIIIDDLYSGSTAAGELSNMLLAINFFLLNNPDKTVKIQKIDFDINCSERISRTRIENVITAKRAYYPGELIDVAIYLKNERGNTPQEKVQVKAPNLKPGSTFYLLVADRSEIINFDNRNIKAAYFPTKLNTLIRAINNLRKNNRIYIKIMTPSQGVYIKGHEYAHLPSTMQNLFIYNTKSAAQSKIKYSTLSEYQIPIPAVVTGHKLFKLKIKERSDIDAE
ncbi:MAG: hypothetical protein GY757_48540, partial [bacterium]|nr:hypothetical protein [bacterium]